jgi:two-component system LytT family response regulator
VSPIRTLIVDDEPLARRRIRQLLADHPDFAVQGECASGAEALHALAQEPAAVDLVFLDVHMPGFDGLQVVQQLPALALPLVVFVTAYDRYMLQAFEAHAVDYLLKPLDPDRFARCLANIRHRVGQQRAGAAAPPVAALQGPPPPIHFPAQLLIKQPGRMYFVPTEQVAYLEATGNYVTVHAQGEPHLLRTTLGQLAQQLDPQLFLRIHRSLIVNTRHVQELRPWTHGEYLLKLVDGTHLTSSRSYTGGIQHFIQKHS